jgi:hypothetical protein
MYGSNQTARLGALVVAGFLVGAAGVTASAELLTGSTPSDESPVESVAVSTPSTTLAAPVVTSVPPPPAAAIPSSTTSDVVGLCTAYFTRQGFGHGHKDKDASAAFEALVAAAPSSPGMSDAERIAAWCSSEFERSGDEWPSWFPSVWRGGLDGDEHDHDGPGGG